MALEAHRAEAVAEAVAVEEDGLGAIHHIEAEALTTMISIMIIMLDPLEAETPRVSSGGRQITTAGLL